MPSPDRPSALTVAVIADPGLPSRRLAAIERDLRTDLLERLPADSRIVTATTMIPVDENYDITFSAVLETSELQEAPDITVLLTEMPRAAGRRPVLTEIFPDQRTAVVSCPTLGVLAPKRRLRGVVLDAALFLADDEGRDEDSDTAGRNIPTPTGTEQGLPAPRWASWEKNVAHATTGDLNRTDETPRPGLVARTWTGVPRTVLGMVAANDPWRTAPRLSSAMAAAAGVGAFGIFYSSIWQMADALSLVRLFSIFVMALVLMVAWLVFGNRLWDRPKSGDLTPVVSLYNASTVATLLLVICGLYLGLFVFILLSGLVVIDPGFMDTTLGKDAGFGNYVRIAWLSAAMGVVAGALGSSFDSRTDLQKLTHGQRERQRVLTRDPEAEEDPRHQDDVAREG